MKVSLKKLPLRTPHFEYCVYHYMYNKETFYKNNFLKGKLNVMGVISNEMKWWNGALKWTDHNSDTAIVYLIFISSIKCLLGYSILGYVMSLENRIFLNCSVCFTDMLVFNSKCQALNGEMLNMHFISNCQIVVTKFTFSLSDVVKFHLVAAVFIKICLL